jgi:hypothetical protein
MDDDEKTSRIAGGACVMAIGLALAACGAAAGTACPAIGWSNTLTVGLADDWPPVQDGSLRVECSSRCGMYGREGPADELTVPLDGRSTVVQLDMTAPDSVVLTVLGVDGTELAVLDADLDWRRVGGSEECGGPHAASVVVPEP